MVSVLAFKPGDPGSIPGLGVTIMKFPNFFLLIEDKIIYRCRSCLSLSPRQAAESNLPGKTLSADSNLPGKTLSALLKQINMPGETKLGHEKETCGKKRTHQENVFLTVKKTKVLAL